MSYWNYMLIGARSHTPVSEVYLWHWGQLIWRCISRWSHSVLIDFTCMVCHDSHVYLPGLSLSMQKVFLMSDARGVALSQFWTALSFPEETQPDQYSRQLELILVKDHRKHINKMCLMCVWLAKGSMWKFAPVWGSWYITDHTSWFSVCKQFILSRK